MKAHDLLREYTKALINGNGTSLVVKGVGGIGKSHTVLDELEKAGLEENVHFIYIAGHITPLQLFNTLAKSITLESPKIFVLDDIDSLITNKVSVALLKSALGEVRGKRIVSYQSSSSKVEGSHTIEFEGRIILILNDIKQENAFGKPLLDRCIVYDMSLSQKELIEYIDETIHNIKTPLDIDTRKAIWASVKQFSDNQRFSVRSLVRAFEFYQYDKEKWRPLFVNSLKLDIQQKIHYAMANATEKEKVEEYIKQTGRSRRSYFREKKVSAKVPALN